MKIISLMRRMLLVLSVAAAPLALGAVSAHAADSGKKAAPPIRVQTAPARPSLAEPPPPAPAAANKISSDTVILKINGEEIKEGRLDEIINQLLQNVAQRLGPMFNPDSLPPALQENLRVEALKQLKNKVLLDQAIAALDYKPTAAEIQNEWDLMEMRLKISKGEEASLKAEIEAAQKQDPTITEAFIRDNLKSQIQAIQTIGKELGASIDPSPEEIQKIYDKDPQMWGHLHACHILIASKQEPAQGDAVTVDKDALTRAEEALKEVKAGKDFAGLAKKYSDDKGNADKGGDLDFFYFEMMVPPFSEAAFKLKKGETSGLVKSDFGFHIIKSIDFQSLKLDDPKNKLDTRKRIQLYTRNTKMRNSLELAMMGLAKRAKIEDVLNPAPAKAAPAAASPAPAAAKK